MLLPTVCGSSKASLGPLCWQAGGKLTALFVVAALVPQANTMAANWGGDKRGEAEAKGGKWGNINGDERMRGMAKLTYTVETIWLRMGNVLPICPLPRAH